MKPTLMLQDRHGGQHGVARPWALGRPNAGSWYAMAGGDQSHIPTGTAVSTTVTAVCTTDPTFAPPSRHVGGST